MTIFEDLSLGEFSSQGGKKGPLFPHYFFQDTGRWLGFLMALFIDLKDWEDVFSLVYYLTVPSTRCSSRRGEARSQQRRANQRQWTFSVQVIILQEIMHVKRTCWIFSANISLSVKSFPGKLLPAELALECNT